MGCIDARNYESGMVILGSYSGGVNPFGDCEEDCGICCIPQCGGFLTCANYDLDQMEYYDTVTCSESAQGLSITYYAPLLINPPTTFPNTTGPPSPETSPLPLFLSREENGFFSVTIEPGGYNFNNGFPSSIRTWFIAVWEVSFYEVDNSRFNIIEVVKAGAKRQIKYYECMDDGSLIDKTADALVADNILISSVATAYTCDTITNYDGSAGTTIDWAWTADISYTADSASCSEVVYSNTSPPISRIPDPVWPDTLSEIVSYTCSDETGKSGCQLAEDNNALGTWFAGLTCEIAESGYGGCSGLINL